MLLLPAARYHQQLGASEKGTFALARLWSTIRRLPVASSRRLDPLPVGERDQPPVTKHAHKLPARSGGDLSSGARRIRCASCRGCRAEDDSGGSGSQGRGREAARRLFGIITAGVELLPLLRKKERGGQRQALFIYTTLNSAVLADRQARFEARSKQRQFQVPSAKATR